MNKVFEKIIEKLEETDFNDIQMVVREVLLKYGFPYESVVQDEVWDALDGLSTNKFAIEIVKQCSVSDDVCEWKLTDTKKVMPYKTSCGNEDLYDNSYIYCPYCGKKIKIVGD